MGLGHNRRDLSPDQRYAPGVGRLDFDFTVEPSSRGDFAAEWRVAGSRILLSVVWYELFAEPYMLLVAMKES
jgi:hypothetical protein